MTSRRLFLRESAAALVAARYQYGHEYGRRPLPASRAAHVRAFDIMPRAGDPTLAELAARALDAARAAGATYADVRFTLTHREVIENIQGRGLMFQPTRLEHVAVGIRALVDGYWGFVGGVTWTADAVTQLATRAVAQAKVNTWGKTRTVRLDLTSAASRGSWTTPIRRDPFDVPTNEKADLLFAFHDAVYGYDWVSGMGSTIEFQRQDQTFASTDGALTSQTVYTALPDSGSLLFVSRDIQGNGSRNFDLISVRGGGYEVLEDLRLIRAIPRYYEQAMGLIDARPVEVGRYDLVFDAAATAAILDGTIGQATQLDRAVGYEANATGTSFLSPFADVVGKYQVGSELITVSANRSMAGGAATVKWDADGVEPDEATLVKNGVVVDYQTNREQAAWLADAYRSTGRTPRSHGYADAEHALAMAMQQTPNLVMQPGATSASFDDLVAGTERGIAIVGGRCSVDQQCLNGQGSPGCAYLIRNGKLAGQFRGMAYVFRTPEFWKSVVAIGGGESVATRGFTVEKGEPAQRVSHTVFAVPMKVKQVSVINTGRGAFPW